MRSSLPSLLRWQKLLLSIIGIFPIWVAKLSRWTPLIWALTSMNVGAEYVIFLSLASTGNMARFEPSASVISGLVHHILSKRILNSSMLEGMIVGTIIPSNIDEFKIRFEFIYVRRYDSSYYLLVLFYDILQF